jgi:hypothetical protein
MLALRLADLALCLGIAFCIVLTGCATGGGTEDEPYEPIGSYVPSVVSDQEVQEFFSAHKIPFVADGSRCYQIRVPRSQAKRAANLLKECPLAERMTIY